MSTVHGSPFMSLSLFGYTAVLGRSHSVFRGVARCCSKHCSMTTLHCRCCSCVISQLCTVLFCVFCCFLLALAWNPPLLKVCHHLCQLVATPGLEALGMQQLWV